MQLYQRAKKEYSKKEYARKVMFVETNPCTEFWFLLHFLPNVVCRRYESYEQLLPELQKYMPGYEKTKRYFIRTKLYKYLTENGDLERAISNSEKLCQLCKKSPEDLKAYSEIHQVIKLLNTVRWGNLIVKVDMRLGRKEAIRPHCSQNIHNKIMQTPMTSMYNLSYIFEHIVYRFNDTSFA